MAHFYCSRFDSTRAVSSRLSRASRASCGTRGAGEADGLERAAWSNGERVQLSFGSLLSSALFSVACERTAQARAVRLPE